MVVNPDSQLGRYSTYVDGSAELPRANLTLGVPSGMLMSP